VGVVKPTCGFVGSQKLKGIQMLINPGSPAKQMALLEINRFIALKGVLIPLANVAAIEFEPESKKATLHLINPVAEQYTINLTNSDAETAVSMFQGGLTDVITLPAQ
jgi:hypothetical protein